MAPMIFTIMLLLVTMKRSKFAIGRKGNKILAGQKLTKKIWT